MNFLYQLRLYVITVVYFFFVLNEICIIFSRVSYLRHNTRQVKNLHSLRIRVIQIWKKIALRILPRRLTCYNSLLNRSSGIWTRLQNRFKSHFTEMSNITRLCMKHTVILQWIPSHCGIHGNETADTLAKEGTTYAQNDRSTTYSEVKTIIKAKEQNLFKQNHPHSNRNDPYHLLTRHEQVSIFRLRTGHNRLRNHLFHMLKIGDTDQCRCRTGSQTTKISFSSAQTTSRYESRSGQTQHP